MTINNNKYFTYNPHLSNGDASCENLLIQGDNIPVLQPLGPIFNGQIKCIYIDPPYNNGESYHYYNDSIATIPTAVIGAIKALGNVETLIFGGLDRGIDYREFIDFLINSDIKNLIGLPETGHDILDDVKLRNSLVNAIYAENMEDAVINAINETKENGVCLFSPAAASYNFYKNFEEKGRHFKELVVKYTK